MMFDVVNIVYGVFFICFYIIQNGKVVYEGGLGFMGYNMKGVKEWLERNYIGKLL